MVIKSILPDFQAILRARKLVPEKHITYDAHWAGKFLDFCNRNTQSDHNKLVLEFVDSLQKDKDVPDPFSDEGCQPQGDSGAARP